MKKRTSNFTSTTTTTKFIVPLNPQHISIHPYITKIKFKNYSIGWTPIRVLSTPKVPKN
ncbi:hypothetical protein J7K06_02070 [Candidatus Bathyarchaeota archaeon]|nr:hypothetical protein [Candidatus Bathyarchaeota archaeon]